MKASRLHTTGLKDSNRKTGLFGHIEVYGFLNRFFRKSTCPVIWTFKNVHFFSKKEFPLCVFQSIFWLVKRFLYNSMSFVSVLLFFFFPEREHCLCVFQTIFWFEMHFLYKSMSFVSWPFSIVNVIWMHKSLTVHEVPTCMTKDN